jgi:hypothetical protein
MALITAGCTSSQTTTPATTAQPVSTAAPSDIPGTAGNPPASAGGSSTGATEVNALNSLLPQAPAGWAMDGQPVGSTRFDENNNAWTASSASYSSTANKDTTATITIQDTAGHNVGFRKIWSTFSATENSDGYFRSTTLHGSPAWETHSIGGKTFRTWILVNDRFMVQVSLENGTEAEYSTILNTISFTGIAALK